MTTPPELDADQVREIYGDALDAAVEQGLVTEEIADAFRTIFRLEGEDFVRAATFLIGIARTFERAFSVAEALGALGDSDPRLN